MSEWTLYQSLTLAVSVMAVVIAVLAWRIPRHSKDGTSREIGRFEASQVKDLSAIHSTNGVPTLAQLMEGIKLDSILSELPVTWQDIRTLNERVERPNIKGRPPKREFLQVTLMTRDRGLLGDKHAEKDGDWIISDKHDIMAPYQAPVPTVVQLKEGAPPVRKDEAVIITQDQGSEWDTEFWRKGGRLDQVYLRAKSGRAPEQLESAYRRRLIIRAAWTAVAILLIVDIILLATRYL